MVRRSMRVEQRCNGSLAPFRASDDGGPRSTLVSGASRRHQAEMLQKLVASGGNACQRSSGRCDFFLGVSARVPSTSRSRPISEIASPPSPRRPREPCVAVWSAAEESRLVAEQACVVGEEYGHVGRRPEDHGQLQHRVSAALQRIW